MKSVSNSGIPYPGKQLRNPHFIIILGIVFVITYAYYNWYGKYEWFWLFSVWEFQNDVIGILYIIPILYASLVFWWKGTLIVWSLSILVILPRMIIYSYGFGPFMRNLAVALIPFTLVAVINLELQWRERQRRIASEREQERQYYTNQILKAQEDERRRIAQELHDDTIQELLVVANQAQSITPQGLINSTEKIGHIAMGIRDSILKISDNLRKISLDLRPGVLDNLGLVPAIRWLAEALQKENSITTSVVIKYGERKLSPETEATVFRIVQEALANIKNHSSAKNATIELIYTDKTLDVQIFDDGKGFPVGNTVRKLIKNKRLGIIGMQQRAKSINADINITSRANHGTHISLHVFE